MKNVFLTICYFLRCHQSYNEAEIHLHRFSTTTYSPPHHPETSLAAFLGPVLFPLFSFRRSRLLTPSILAMVCSTETAETGHLRCNIPRTADNRQRLCEAPLSKTHFLKLFNGHFFRRFSFKSRPPLLAFEVRFCGLHKHSALVYK